MLTSALGFLGFVTSSKGKTIAIVIAVVVGVFGLWLYINGLNADIETLKAQKAIAQKNLAIASEVARRNAESAQRLLEDAKRREAALMRERDAYAARAAHLHSMIGEIKNAPEVENGPVAPVLRDTLDRLRHLIDPAAGGDHGDQGGEDKGPREPANVPVRPGAAGRKQPARRCAVHSRSLGCGGRMQDQVAGSQKPRRGRHRKR